MANALLRSQSEFTYELQEEWEVGLEGYADEVGYKVVWGEQVSTTGFYFTLVNRDLTENELLHYVEMADRDAIIIFSDDDWEWSWDRVGRNTYRVSTFSKRKSAKKL